MTCCRLYDAVKEVAPDITVFTTFHYGDVAKYVIETDQPYLSSLVVMSKKWLATLPPDLQKIVRDDAEKVSNEIVPFVKEFFAKQRDIWKSKGGMLIRLPAADQAALIKKISSIGEDLSKDNAGLNKAVKIVFDSAKRNK